MKDLKLLVDDCIAELNSIGIDCGKTRNIEIHTRAKSRWGQCKSKTTALQHKTNHKH